MIDPFRKQALDRISSPEELDRVVRVARPGTWVALGGLLLVIAAVLLWATLSTVTTTISGVGFVLPEGGLSGSAATEEGTIAHVDVAVGTRLAPGGQVAVITTPDGREIPVTSAEAGTVAEILHLPGDFVPPGDVVAIVRPDKPPAVEAFLPQRDAKDASQGDPVWIAPSSASPSQYGYALGTIVRLGQFPIPPDALLNLLESPLAVQQVTSQGPVVHALVEFERADTASGVAWTASDGPPGPLDLGTPTDVQVVIGQRAPIDYVIG
jgi:hypothetical protein